MADFQPVPAWALPFIGDEEELARLRLKFNPVWLKYFLDLVEALNAAGGTTLQHNLLSGLQGGTTDQFYHLTQAVYTAVNAGFSVQPANSVFAGPVVGVAATPVFRALVTADLPAGTGTVTSVAQTFTGGLISVAGSPITTSGTLALTVAGTSGGIPYFSGGTTWASSAALGASQVVLGGGAGAAPNTNSAFTFDGIDVVIGSSLPVKIRDGGIFVNTTPNALSGLQVTRTFTDAASTPGALNFYAKIAQSGASLTTGYASIVQGEFNPNTVTAVNRTITNAYANNTIAYMSGVMSAGTVTGITTLYALAGGLGHTGASPTGTVTNGQVFTANSFSKLGTGSPDVRFSKITGVTVENMGAGAGSGGFTLTNAQGIAIANQSGASNHYNLHVGATNIPVGGSWSIYNESSYRNAHAGLSFFGGTTTPTAKAHLGAGTATANTAPLKFTSGTLLTTAEAGAVEFLTDKFYGTITTGAARKEITLNDAALTSGRIPTATTNGRLTDGPIPAADGVYALPTSITISQGLITAIS